MKHMEKYSDWQESDGYTNANTSSSTVKKSFHCPVCGSRITSTSNAAKSTPAQDSQASARVSSR